jgi:hypothetical protein
MPHHRQKLSYFVSLEKVAKNAANPIYVATAFVERKIEMR